jgi:protocatechuate 3,4-dioxygenase beta subunit
MLLRTKNKVDQAFADFRASAGWRLIMRKLSLVILTLVLLLASQGYGRPAQTQKEPGSITGRVKLDGKPAKGITVIASPSVTDPAKMVEGMFSSSASIKATTDADGIYKLEALPAGKYRVAPSAPALVSADINPAGEITVDEGSAAEGIDFSLSLGGVITGRLTDSDGRPVIGERISLKALDKPDGAGAGSGMASMFGNRMYATDDRGVYRIFGLRPGRYIVSAGKDPDMMANYLSPRPKKVQTFYPSVTEEARAKPVQVTAGSEAAGVDIQFSGADKGFIVSGRVVDSENKTPIANAMVAYSKAQAIGKDGDVRVSTEAVGDSPGMPGGFTTTNDKGEFRFAAVQPGNYKLEATSIGAFAGTGGSQFYAEPLVFEVQSTNLDKLEIKVHRGAGISGIVIIESADARDSLDRFGQLMLIVMVKDEANKSSSSGNCLVGADGSFRLGGLKPGKLTIQPFAMSARRPGLLRVERNGVEVQGALEIQPNEEISGVRVVLTPATGVIRGRVTIQGGTLQTGAKLRAQARSRNDENSEFAGVFGNPSVDVSSNGSFLIENITPGTYEVEVFATVPGQRGSRNVSAKQTVTVTSDSPVDVDLVLDLAKTTDK